MSDRTDSREKTEMKYKEEDAPGKWEETQKRIEKM